MQQRTGLTDLTINGNGEGQMNARLKRFLFGAILASAIAVSLIVLPIPTRAVPTASTFTVNTNLDGVNANACANNTPGQCTLREAILEANASPGATIILPGLLAYQFYYVAIPPSGPDDGTTGDLHINADMSIVGKPTFTHPSTIIDASLAGDRVFNIASGVNVNISNVTIRHGTASSGGGIYNLGTLTLSNSNVFSNTANTWGGGIYNDASATVTLANSTLINNTASAGGGGIFNTSSGSSVTLSNSTVTGNSTTTYGGGIVNYLGATLTLMSSTVSNNTTSDDGGGIYNEGTMTLANSTVSTNATNLDSGGIYNTGTLILTNSTVSNNTTSGSGGGMLNSGATAVTNSAVVSNSASTLGGGILNSGTLTFTNSTISGNTTNGDGGGIYNYGGAAAVMLINSTVMSNTASGTFGGGIFNAGTFTLTNSTVSRNTASANNSAGGGILNEGATILTYVTLSGNGASSGGGIYQKSSYVTQTVTLRSTIIANSVLGGNCGVQPGSPQLKSTGYNLASDGTCAAYFNQTGDLNNTNPKLGPLANNGGPTLTHALLPGSPAIDRIPVGTNDCGTIITTDQRGTPRPIGPRCDIGAYEARNFYLFLPLIAK